MCVRESETDSACSKGDSRCHILSRLPARFTLRRQHEVGNALAADDPLTRWAGCNVDFLKNASPQIYTAVK